MTDKELLEIQQEQIKELNHIVKSLRDFLKGKYDRYDWQFSFMDERIKCLDNFIEDAASKR